MNLDKNMAVRWTEVPDPAMGADEVLIEIHAAALSRADLLQRQPLPERPNGWGLR